MIEDQLISHVLAASEDGSCRTLAQANVLFQTISVLKMPRTNIFIFALQAENPLQYSTVSTVQSVDLRDPMPLFADYPDRRYVERDLIPYYRRVKSDDEPNVMRLTSRIQDVVSTYDRVIVPIVSDLGDPTFAFSLTVTRLVLPVEPTPLSGREDDILDLLIMGNSAKEIALRLNDSFRTVEHTIASIKQKLGARNVAHAVAIGLAKRLTQEPR